MSTVVLMKILEGAPARYDAGMRVLTLGAAGRIQQRAACLAVPVAETRVLEIGCGTGALTQALLERGAVVEALDQDPQMLDEAHRRFGPEVAERLHLHECTAAEIDRFDDNSFDSVAASLSLSEMSPIEREFVLSQAFRALRNGGRLCIADEVRPRPWWGRLFYTILRVPLAAAAWCVAGSTTAAIPDLAAEVTGAGFYLVSEERFALGMLAVVVAEKPT